MHIADVNKGMLGSKGIGTLAVPIGDVHSAGVRIAT
jgi:hypothetical protein